MHTQSTDKWRHGHAFLGAGHERNERRTWFVVILTAVMMVLEIVGGTIWGSMALVADGWHMSTHAAALGIAGMAYLFARRHAHDPRFSFGTGKLGELAGFASAIILAMIALGIGYQSAVRLGTPVPISFDQAIPVAILGLVVNLASIWLLAGEHDHDHHHGHSHEHHHDGDHYHDHGGHGGDHNLRAAYLHVLADAFTSVLAIAGLLSAKYYGWNWMDPAVGIVGALVIASWSLGLVKSSGMVLLDEVPDPRLVSRIKRKLEVEDDKVVDLHLWRLGPGHTGLIASIVSHHPKDPSEYKVRLAGIEGLSHVTFEVHRCN